MTSELSERPPVLIRNTTPDDFAGIMDLSKHVYPGAPAWRHDQLASHLRVFPEGQFVALREGTNAVLGFAASLIVLWDDYAITTSWRDFTDGGMFTNHDPEHGRTLYGAEIMVDPFLQGQGIGKKLYAAREALTRERGLLRVRAGARLRDYHQWSSQYTPTEYVDAVVRGELRDRTLSFQLGSGFRVIGVATNYLRDDPESLGNAAVIEWLNPERA